MACGNNHVSRDYLSSAPVSQSPVQEIHVRLPGSTPTDALKTDVWTTRSGSFKDRDGVSREFDSVSSPGRDKGYERGKPSWDFQPAPGANAKAYTHMTARAGWLGPDAVLDRLPKEAADALRGRRSIVLGKSAKQTWVNERATTFDSRHREQTTVVRPAKR
jgi:hypothetical protein